MRLHLILLPPLLLAATLLSITIGLAQADDPADSPDRPGPVRLAMFYHPPRGALAPGAAAETFATAIFTQGDERYRDEMRAAGFAGPILQYLLANETVGPAGLRDAGSACGPYGLSGNNVSGRGGDFCAALHHDERNFLHNGHGERLYWRMDGRTYYLMNPAAPAWQAYFARRAAEQLRTLGYSGLFLDNLDLTTERAQRQQANSDGQVREYSSDPALQASVRGYLTALRTALPEATLWANLIGLPEHPLAATDYLTQLDGLMNEAFVAHWRGSLPSPAVWQADLDLVESVTSLGKTYLAVAQGPQSDTRRMRFALASYLLVAAPSTYFRYADGQAYEQAWLYDDYLAALGTPLGPRYPLDRRWRRDFSHGYVSVDPAASDGQIVVTGAG
jgi:putative glycosyl hydrolase-like family 15 (GHL15) protein